MSTPVSHLDYFNHPWGPPTHPSFFFPILRGECPFQNTNHIISCTYFKLKIGSSSIFGGKKFKKVFLLSFHTLAWYNLKICQLPSTSGEGNGSLLQYGCLENPMDRGAWQAAVHGVAKSWDTTKRLHFHFTSQLPFVCEVQTLEITLLANSNT